jgi:hypothetical protein
MSLARRGDRGVDGFVHGGGVSQRAVVQTAQCAATDAAAFAGAQRQFNGDSAPVQA